MRYQGHAVFSAFQPERATFHAGRVMLERPHNLAKERVDFAFETTPASRSFAPWIAKMKQSGYTFDLVFLWLPSADFAAARVAEIPLPHGVMARLS
jgi:predicted ABC-type ATPase